MKTRIDIYILTAVAGVCLVGLSRRAALAEQTPSLAIAGVQATPVLLKKYPPHAARQAVAVPEENKVTGTITGMWTGPKGKTSVPLDFVRPDSQAGLAGPLGDWKGTMVWARHRLQLVLHFAALPNGRVSARLDILGQYGQGVPEPGLSAQVVEYNPPRLRIKWPDTGSYEGVFTPGRTSSPILAQSPSLEEVLHALDVQLADRFGAVHMFTVLEESDLRQTITVGSGQANQVCNLRNPRIAEQYQSAGIDYLLMTTLEDFEDQTLDLMQGRVDVARVDIKGSKEHRDQFEGTASRTEGRFGNRNEAVARSDAASSGSRQGSSSLWVSGQATMAQLDPSIQKGQSVRLGVRFRLYHAANGTLLDTASYTFQTNRTYVAVAGGSNFKAASDCYQCAARNCAGWAANRITEVVFPIKVLEKNDGVITINRGEGSAVQVGQVFRIFAVGNELRDPSTGEVLGRDETTVGKVTISELHPKFSKARIIEDTGIAPGAILRRL